VVLGRFRTDIDKVGIREGVMKVLVTGGAGFVGSVLVPHLIWNGFEVRVFDNLMHGIDPLFLYFGNPRFEFVKGDVRNEKELSSACRGVDAIIHLAALVGYPICKKYEREAYEVNVGGTRNLCKVAPDVPIVFASTGSVYGEVKGVCKEDSPLNTETIYGQTKVLAELAVRERGNFIIYRFATGFGVSPRMRLDLLINDFCYKALKERNLIVYERHFKRTFIHVTDMARAFSWAITNFEARKMKNGIYNVGSEEMNLSKQQIAELIREKVEFYLHYADIGSDEDKRNYEVSYEKIRGTGWDTKMSLDDGIAQLLDLFESFEVSRPYSNV